MLYLENGNMLSKMEGESGCVRVRAFVGRIPAHASMNAPIGFQFRGSRHLIRECDGLPQQMDTKQMDMTGILLEIYKSLCPAERRLLQQLLVKPCS